MDNLTIFTEFLLMDISNSEELQVLQGLLFLLIYLGALTGNLLTVTVIVTDPHLHSPMYFFLGNLSFIDLCSISVTVPKITVNSLADSKLISLPACAAQIFLVIFFVSTELAFLVVMSYDCFVAICHPLHYGITITPCLCTKAAGGSWASGFIQSAIHTGVMFRLPLTESNEIHQYFCDIPQILRISSPDVQFSESMTLVLSACITLVCSAFIVKSYIDNFSMVYRMHSVEARNKALSTCTPQLAILILFAISGVTAVLSPTANKASFKNILTGMFYSMVPPFINPIIYCLRNREINNALGKMFHRYFKFSRKVFIDLKILKNILVKFDIYLIYVLNFYLPMLNIQGF